MEANSEQHSMAQLNDILASNGSRVIGVYQCRPLSQ